MQDCRRSPAQMVFGRLMRDFIPSLTYKHEPAKDWAVTQEHRERTLATKRELDKQRWSHRTKDLDYVELGTAIAIQDVHADKAPAVVHGGVPDVRFEEVQDTEDVHHQVDIWQDGQAVDGRDDVPTGGRDDQDQGRLFEDVTEVVEPNEGSTRPKRSPKPNPKYSPNDYDLSYVGHKSWTRSRRSRAGTSSR